MSGTYKDLEVWQAAMALAISVCRHTATFPNDERFGLTVQMRRAAVSVPSNIAEGKGRPSDAELIHYLGRARGSLFEIDTQLAIGEQLGYASKEKCDVVRHEISRVGQMLSGLIRAVRPAA